MQGERPASSARHRLARVAVESARRRAGRGRLRRGGGERVELPAGREARLAHLALERQEAAAERRMRPVGGERHLRARAHRREGQVAGADELEPDLGTQRLLRADVALGDVGMKAARMRDVARAGEHRHDGAIDLHRRAAHATRVAERDEHRRRVALHPRAGMNRLRDEREPVVPGRHEARLQHVAVDLEDAAVARLDRDVALDVEGRGRLDEREVAPLRHRRLLLALALRRLPALGAVARQHGADERLRGGEAGCDAALGLAQPAGALGDDAAHRFEREDEREQHGREREPFADEGEASGGGHGCAFVEVSRRSGAPTRTIAAPREESSKAV